MIRLLGLCLCMMSLGDCAGITAKSRAALAVGSTFVDCPGCPRMLVVPAGQFAIGSPATQTRRDFDEGPQKTFHFAHAFAIDLMPVTRGQYAAFSRDTDRPSVDECYADRHHPGRSAIEAGTSWRDPGFRQTDRNPVVCVNFDEMRAYIAWLNKRAGGGYRLMSQAE